MNNNDHKLLNKYKTILLKINNNENEINVLNSKDDINLIKILLNEKISDLRSKIWLNNQKHCNHNEAVIYSFEKDDFEGRKYAKIICKKCGFVWEERYFESTNKYKIELNK